MSASTTDERLRIGAVSYLNTKPLVYGLEELLPDAEISFDLPSRLASKLADRQLDVALIPSIEFFNDPNYSIVSDACIGCRGPVLSVKLLSRVPFASIQSVALDEGSRTSIALSRILLHERFGLQPERQPLAIGSDPLATSTDAVLLIGDRAIHPPEEHFPFVWDLGDEWCKWSELSFVFAMWVARPGVNLRGVDVALSEARDRGVAHLEEIARDEAAAVQLSPEACLSYLRDNLYFFLGLREQRGLGLYYEHAAKLGLARQGLDLRFDDCTAT